jgi:DNA/RNA endonuclease G (NUC1)
MKALHRLVLAELIFVAAGASAQSFKPIVPAQGYQHGRYAPVAEAGDFVKEFRAYLSVFDGRDDDNGDGISDLLGVPEFVAYEMKQAAVDPGPAPNRPGWMADPALRAAGVMPDDSTYHFSRDYRQAHPDDPQLQYVRGHLCTKVHAWRLGADADWNTHTFYNAVPQNTRMNGGIWLDLENLTAEWADRYGEIWIIAGPVFYGDAPSAWLGQPDEIPAAIPDALFKIVIRELPEGGLETLAFLYVNQDIPKTGRSYDHSQAMTSIDFLEWLTGADFLPSTGAEQQQRLESAMTRSLWP